MLTCLAVPASPSAAQTASQPMIVVTIIAGGVVGHELWSIPRQQLCVLSGSGACSGVYDTLRLSRSIGANLALGASVTYFPWPSVGLSAEVSYVGLPLDDSCAPIFVNPDPPDDRNRQICDNLRSESSSGGAIAVFVGALMRAAPRRAVSPYLRGSVGIVNHSRSSVEVVGAYLDGAGFHERQVIFDPSPRHMVPMFGLAAGLTSPIGAGYQFRLELRDIVAPMDRVTGRASDLAVAPTDSRFYHNFALILGLDIVLERSRGRRY